MDLSYLKSKVMEFDKENGWDKTTFDQLVGFLQEELDNLKSCEDDKARVDHLLTDLLVLIMQIGYRYGTDFDSELEKWFEENKSHI